MMAKLKSQQVEALQNARDINAQWQSKVDTETKLQKAKLDDVQRHLDTVIVSLRNRPSRSDSLPATPDLHDATDRLGILRQGLGAAHCGKS